MVNDTEIIHTRMKSSIAQRSNDVFLYSFVVVASLVANDAYLMI